MTDGVSQSVLLRLGSRRAWWAAKLLTLLVAVLLFLIVTVGLTTAVTSFVLRWPSRWSPAAVHMPMDYLIAPSILAMAPAWASAQMLLLLGLGWYCMGIVVLVVSLRTSHPAWGFGAGALLNFSGLVGLRDGLAPYVHLSIHEHLLFNLHAFGDSASPYLPVVASLLYWAVGIAALALVGLYLARQLDFLYRAEGQ